MSAANVNEQQIVAALQLVDRKNPVRLVGIEEPETAPDFALRRRPMPPSRPRRPRVV
jgi:hypothetical protein